MSSLEAAITEVRNGPSGPRIAAFFDFDGTLIDGYSVAEFFKHRLFKGEIGLPEAGQLLLSGIRGIETEADFDEFVTVGFRAWKGKTEAEMEALGERLFALSIARCLYPEAWELIEAHRLMGHTLVIASSATRFQIQPMARELGIEHVLCTGIQVRKGVLTGRPSGALAWGEGKADTVRKFAARRRIDLERSYAYANGDEDQAFLQTVGRPRAVNPQPRLAEAAARGGWPVLSFKPRGGRPDLLTIARSVAAYAGMAGGLGVGLWAGLLKRSHREAINRSATLVGDLGLAIAGIEIKVQGEDHLWSHRPAMFLFNHQSQLDVLDSGQAAAGELLRGGQGEHQERSRVRSVLPVRRRRLRGTGAQGAEPRCARARGGETEERAFAGHGAGGNKVADSAPRGVPKGRVSPGHAGASPDRPHRHSQRGRAVAARRGRPARRAPSMSRCCPPSRPLAGE